MARQKQGLQTEDYGNPTEPPVGQPPVVGIPDDDDGCQIVGEVFLDVNRSSAKRTDKDGIGSFNVKLLQETSDGKFKAMDPASTDSDGKFSFADLDFKFGYRVMFATEVDTSGMTFAGGTQPGKMKLAVPANAAVDVRFSGPGQIKTVGPIGYEARGAFVDGVVTPRAPQIPITLVNTGTREELTALTDAQGHYFFDEPSPATYMVLAPLIRDDNGFTLSSSPPAAFALSAGEERQFNFDYTAQGGSVHGVLFFDPQGVGRRTHKTPGIRNATVDLTNDAGVTLTALTNSTGDYFFDNVAAGHWRLTFAAQIADMQNNKHIRTKAGDSFELISPDSQDVTVVTGQTAEALPTAYAQEPHILRGIVKTDSGQPVVGLRVALFNADNRDEEIDAVTTDKNGEYKFTGHQGNLIVKFDDPPFASQIMTRRVLEAEVHSEKLLPDTVYRGEIMPPGAATGIPPTGSMQDAVLDIASYMPTSGEMVYPPSGSGGVSRYGGGGHPDLQQMVDGALVQVLGRKSNSVDAQGFRASLDRAFTCKVIDGRGMVQWTPRTYAVETELGAALSGAQASLYHLAKAALDDALPLLDGLYPLRADFDPQNVEAVRSIVKTELGELVNELGSEGGPTLQRVDDLFGLLDLQLTRLKREFGFENAQVNTVDEEQNLTNFLVVRDYVASLLATWNNQTRKELGNFLGTQLVLLARALSSVGESADQAAEAMDAVFLGAMERQTVSISFRSTIIIDNQVVALVSDPVTGMPVAPPSMQVSELLNWILRFARDEGPSLIRDGGRIGVNMIQPTAERLRRLVIGSQQATVSHIGFTRSRVRRALSELAGQLAFVATLAQQLNLTQTPQI